MKKILLVDDDKMTLKLLKSQLEKRNFQCFIFPDSNDDIVSFIEKKQIDLVLLDIMMPNKSGDEYLKEIRGRFSRLALPVIMSTSKSEDEDIVSFLKMGANDYLVKPININIGVERINTQTQLKDLMRDAQSFEEAKTINKMLNTLSHEIKNPLTIAMMQLPLIKRNDKSEEKVQRALMRISNLMDQMHSALDQYQGIESNPVDELYKVD